MNGNDDGNRNANENATTRLLQLHYRLMMKRSGSSIGDINRVRREVHASPEWQLAIRESVLKLQRRAMMDGA